MPKNTIGLQPFLFLNKNIYLDNVMLIKQELNNTKGVGFKDLESKYNDKFMNINNNFRCYICEKYKSVYLKIYFFKLKY